MPIEFACQCGKTLRAAEEHAGKRAKCNKCGQTVAIPGVKTAAPKTAPIATPPKKAEPIVAAKPVPSADLYDFFASELLAEPPAATAEPLAPLGAALPSASKPGSRTCPGCSKPLSNAAVVCIKCGFNLKTGEKMKAFTYCPSSDREERKPRRPSRIGRFFVSRLTSGKFLGGLAMMVGAVIWFFGGLAVGIIFFYPPILLIIGFFTCLTGLIDGDVA